ncbi:MAG: hypothetical protein A3J46_02895 [Candidatus Yanofskybacteria bacterium RIFCSPHIGHO2_02_FULL_41_11]|uniref:Uncharacterized protein n=1 Tax=Candidatus Yanofskybacteria bacterium RIFCSPHIGHO2_02_FULL_41_11 TaxID=1802675 RepID=A0A1F8F661_9BACT|nr:MAG: hypothetical protein A3J46_02895 [Candidatus Yanofskybacteria bacterium RIFCSPHIGHO2_02_FULL_41_11]
MIAVVLYFICFMLFFFFLPVLKKIGKSLSEISESLGVLANHLEHPCGKCKAEAENRRRERRHD